ncbi:MAG: hypothetical protein Kow0092_20920 [Deferrisomatales bacterium]
MSSPPKRPGSLVQLLSILVVGAGVGWLAGLSVSPVIATVLASLLGVAGGIVAGARGSAGDAPEATRGEGLSRFDARPAAVLVLGIALGAPLGIVARTHRVFEPAGPEPGKPSREGVLFALTVEQCETLRALADFPNERAYRDVLAASGAWARALEREVADTAKLKAIVEELCAGP